MPILERHHVDVVFAGHEHNYQRAHPRRNGEFVESGPGTTYIVTGGGGAPLYETRDDRILAAKRAAYHYVRAEVSGLHLRLSALDANGELIDSAELAPPPEINSGGVVDSTSYASVLRPGGYVTIFGRHLATAEFTHAGPALRKELGDVTVTLNGAALSLLYVSPGQINARLPVSASGAGKLQVHSRNGMVEAPAAVGEAR